MTPVEPDEVGDVDVGDTIAICEAERVVPVQIMLDGFQAPTGLSFGASFDERNSPRLAAGMVNLQVIFTQVYRNICGMKKIIREVFLNHIAFVPKTYDEIVDPSSGINLHNVPKNWHSTYFNHRLRTDRGFLA